MSGKTAKELREKLLQDAKEKSETAKAQSVNTARTAQRVKPSVSKTYMDALNQTLKYARLNNANMNEVANTLTTGMTKREQGDLNTWDWDVMRQTVLDNASAIKTVRDRDGLYDSANYANNRATVSLVSLPYLQEYVKELEKKLGQAQEADRQAQVRKEQTADTQSRWADLFKAKETENESDQWYNYLMADYLLGDRDELFDYEKINARYEAMDDDTYYAEEKRLRDQFDSLDWTALTGSDPDAGMADTYSDYIKTVNREIKRRDNLEAMQGQIRANADYGAMSAYTGKQLAEPDRLINGGLQNREDIRTISNLYSFMNIDATHKLKKAASGKLGAVNQYLNEGYDMLTSDELADYNYLYNAGRKKEAAEYLELLRPDLLSRRAKVNQAYTEAKATAGVGNAVLSWLEARGNQLGSMMLAPFQAYETAMGRDDPNSAYFDTNNKANWVQEAQLGAINDSDMADWLKATLSYTYMGVTGAADNGVRLLASGGNPTAALIGAGLSAASSSLHESSERDDMSAAAKIIKAIGTGAVEIGTEKIGLDALFDKGQKNALNYIKNVIASELGEETISYLSEDALEMVVGFLFDYEAEIKSGEEFWKGLTDTWITTAISAGIMGAPGAVSVQSRNSRMGKTVSKNGSAEQILSIAENMGAGSKASETAKAIRQKTESGKKISLPQLGMLTYELEQELTQENASITNQVMDKAIEERLAELGSDQQTAKKNASAVRKIAFGQELSAGEKRMVQWDDNASQVVKELAKPIAEGEEGRVGADWVTEARKKAAMQTRENTAKQADLIRALQNKKDAQVSDAEKKALEKTDGQKTAAKGKMTARKLIFSSENGETEGNFLRFEKKEDGIRAVVETGGGEQSIDIADIKKHTGIGTATIIEYVADAHHDMSETEANTMMTLYERQGGDAGRFITDFETVYSAGFAGVEAAKGLLPDDMQMAVYEQARREGEAAEQTRVQQAKQARDAAEGTVAWLGKVQDNSAITGTGDQEAVETAMENMTESQKTTVEAVQAFARDMRVNVVLYESDAEQVQQIANGKYDASTHTVYLDINSGAASEQGIQRAKENNTLGYAMMMTLGHELTHHMEATSAEGYAKYKAAVKAHLDENGQSWTQLVREKIEIAARDGRKITRMGAEAEVVADASEYMLQDSAFTKRLDTGIRQKVKEFVQGFVQKVQDIFKALGIGRSHRESNALRELAKGVMHYTANLQELWDAGMEETIQGGSEVEVQGEVITETAETKNEAVEDVQAAKQFSIRDSQGEEIVLTESELEENKKRISNMQSVAKANGNMFTGLSAKEYTRNVKAYFNENGNTATNKYLGEVKISNEGIKHLERFRSELKSSLVPCIKEVIEKGLMIDIDDQHKGSNKQTAVLAAPVTLDGQGYYMGVAVRQEKNLDNFYYIHEAAIIQKEKGDYPTTKTELNSAEPLPGSHPSIYSILDSIRKYNRESVDLSENDVQFSTRDQTDAVSVREYLSGMKPQTYMNDTEKALLQRYQDKLKELHEKQQAVAEQDEIIKTATGEELMKATNRRKVLKIQLDRVAASLARVESAKGFAGIMATSRKVVDMYLNNMNFSVADAHDSLVEEIKGLTDQLRDVGRKVEETAQGQRNAVARGLFDPEKLRQAAKKVKADNATSMSEKVIADRLALAWAELCAANGQEGGKRFASAMKELAEDIIRTSDYRQRSETLRMIAEEMPSISLTESDRQEIRNAGLTVSQYKRALEPYVRVTDSASDLAAIEANAEYYGGVKPSVLLGEENPQNMAMALYETITREKADDSTGKFEGMTETESIGVLMGELASADMPMAANSDTLNYLRTELKKYAGKNETAAQMVEEALKRTEKAARRATGMWTAAAKNKQLANQAVAYYRALEEQRRLIELKEQKQRLEKELTSDVAKRIQERVKEQKKESNEYWAAKINANRMREKIGRNMRKLNKLRMHETDRQHVHQEMQHVADLVLKTFTEGSLAHFAFEPQNTAMLASYYNALLSAEKDYSYYWDDDIAADIQELQRLSDEYREAGIKKAQGTWKYEAELTILSSADSIISNVLYMIENHQRQFVNGKQEDFNRFAEKSAKTLCRRKDAINLAGNLGKAQKIVDALIRNGNMTPIYFFEHLKNDEILKDFNDLRKAQTRCAKITLEAKEAVKEIKSKRNYYRWAEDGKLTFRTKQGHEITLSREQALWAYATAKRERTNRFCKTEHLSEGGFHFKTPNSKGGVEIQNTNHKLEASDITIIESWLTQEQKAYADDIVEYLSTTMGEYGNQAAMEMYGYKKFNESYYFPFQTKTEQRFLHGDEGAGGQNAQTGRVKNASYTKKLKRHATTALVMDNFTTVAVDHMQSMAAYASMVQPIENLKRLLNFTVLQEDGSTQTYRQLMEQKYGKPTLDYLMNFLKDVNGATQTDNRASGGFNYLMRVFKSGAVMASTSVTLQQPTAIARAMAMVNPRYFTGNPFYRPGKGVWDEMLRHCGTAIIKDMGRFDVGLGKTAAEYIEGDEVKAHTEWMNAFRAMGSKDASTAWMKSKEAVRKTVDKLNALPGLADQWTWGLIWQAVKNEQAAQHPDMDVNSDAFLDLCGERFDDVVDHTQVYDSVLTRSDLMRSSNPLHKMATAFMAEPTTSINMLYDAVVGNHTGAQRAGIVGSVVASNILAGLAAALVQALNDDDDKRNWMEKYADRATGNVLDNINPAGMIPYVQDIVSICQGFNVERLDMSVIADIYECFQMAWKKFKEGEALTWKEWENFAGTLANLIGVPAKNISREIRRGWNLLKNTEWAKPNASNVGYAMAENLPGYDSKNSAYYERIVTAMLNGDDEKTERLRTYMLTSKSVEEDKLKSGIKSELGNRVKEGAVDQETAEKFLLKNKLLDEDADENDAFWQVDEWLYVKETGKKDYRKYNEFKEAIKTEENIDKVLEKYLEHDVGRSQLISALKDVVLEGEMDKETAMKRMMKYGLTKSEDDAYWTVKRWEYEIENGTTDGYKKYSKFFTAVESGENLKAVIAEYTDNGVTEKTLKGQITEEYKPRLKELYTTNRTEFANLQARVLTAYQALGYDRDEMLKDIKKWVTE
ncbi:MAG: hypothetical protein ACI4WX_11080 [Aristaeellaceae bacterium]